ncbi:MAG: helix-turn-helix transcriptional regulator [Caldilineaceae bacterium]|nr:helix-turn-helix transcriptional regulator [Caldilineaceae bacterium]
MNEAATLAEFGERVRRYRNRLGISQEKLGFNSNLDRTYISDIERGKRNVSLLNITNIAKALKVTPASLVTDEQPKSVSEIPSYYLRSGVEIDCGFDVTGEMVLTAVTRLAEELQALPFSLYRSIDLKTLSGIVGALFATHIANQCGAIVNPIEKGHPDVIPVEGADATEEELRNYGVGLEVKCTVGNVQKGRKLDAGEGRLDFLTGISWQAHHRQVESLLGLVVDFAGKQVPPGQYPIVTAAFFTDNLVTDDWGKVSGLSGRNTKVTGMLTSGKKKMGKGWILFLDNKLVYQKYSKILNFSLE